MKSGFELKSISMRYTDVNIVSDVSFAIRANDRLAILGPSGSGKSTILRLLAGLEQPTQGQIFLDGTLVSDTNRILVPPHQREIAMVFQDLALWPNLSVLDNVLLGMARRRLSKKDAHNEAVQALSLCRIELLASRKPGMISGGEQQRVALARAIASRPAFLFLDEPFSGLDLITKSELLGDISELIKRNEIALVLVSHDPMEAVSLCKSAIVLNQGCIEDQGNLNELLQAPQSVLLRLFKAQLILKGD